MNIRSVTSDPMSSNRLLPVQATELLRLTEIQAMAEALGLALFEFYPLEPISSRGWQVIPPDNLPLFCMMPLAALPDRERVIGYLQRQITNPAGGLLAWLVRRENAYFCGPGSTWDPHLITYSAARDAACWQLHRREREVWELLEGFDEAAIFPASTRDSD